MEFILPALWGLQLWHHRILTESEQYYPFVPHSHAILHFCAFWTLVLHYESSCGPFLLNFLIQDPLSHSVLLCEWHVLFQFTDGEDLVAICYFMLWALFFFGALLWYTLSLWRKWLLRASWPFSWFMAWDHLYLINCLTLSSPRRLSAVTPLGF